MNHPEDGVRKLNSFPPLWKEVANVCNVAFQKVKKRPSHDLGKDYNELLAQICDAYGLVYDLTAYKCSNYPALVRGSNSTPVVGQTEESTQVLVVYYLLRELLKRQVSIVKTTIQKDSLNSYLDAFEKFTAGANLVKPIFTYLHWTWQKRGMPPEHVIQPTEIVVGHLWLDVILSQELKDSFRAKVNEIVCRVRSGGATSVGEMESVKRFSLNLGCATDVRLVLYSSVVVETYLGSLRAYYMDKKPTYKQLGVVDYIRQCVKVVKKEDVLARCFLMRSSYGQVSEEVLKVLLLDEKDYLQPYCKKYLDVSQNEDPMHHKEFLVALYSLLGGGADKSWMEDLLKSTVAQYTARELRATAGASEPQVALRVLRDALHVYEVFVDRVFNNSKRLRSAIHDGIAANLAEFERGGEGGDNAAKLAKCLARNAAEVVKTAPLSELEKADNWVAVLYRLSSKQDEFNKAYTHLLQERIVANMFSFERHTDFVAREESLLSGLLMRDSNFGFVFDCMHMVNDASRSDRRVPTVENQLTVRPCVLGAYAWGEVRRARELDTRLIPVELLSIVRSHISTYEAVKHGRKLLFSPEHSGCRVRMCVPGCTTPVTLVVSLLQTRLLLAMNATSEWTLDGLCERIAATSAECLRALKPFLQTSLLEEKASNVFVFDAANIAAQGSAQEGYDLRCVDFNTHQSHAGKYSPSARADKTHAFAIQGAVVRQLKEKGPLPLEAIMTSVGAVLSKLSIQKRDIKKVLEKLIEREVVKRDDATFSFIP
ncbi:hypothetical protein ABB37_00862 [Leptomonas pyrrhocoris]|uniref:Cullin family profile domain-containing protein n=1 Tax=Leptomonas pyrrhocoris TaxID=157538 RepID=A0A0M9GBI1_LEPPY|nr:hypothetical protein ABB37_00862 [Leptomonas pyrrhocoris]KPA86799.1 hypothetical protein ABB37_00862 [Leptomonas pyrrhocoris]|eukprot:XP_015665238.1 hypothetical protein ABB37_00862 [Leptomonas pyrrhocoris]